MNGTNVTGDYSEYQDLQSHETPTPRAEVEGEENDHINDDLEKVTEQNAADFSFDNEHSMT